MSTTTSGQPSGSSWTQKAIDVTITLGTGSFGGTGQNTVKLSGLRVKADIIKSGFPAMDKAIVRVYGVTPDVMNTVSTLGIPLTFWRLGNSMLIEAGDVGGVMSVVYSGYLHQAYQNFDESPETSLVLVGWGGGRGAGDAPIAPVSYAGSVDVATIAASIAQQAGWKFENSGVQIQHSNTYLAGTAVQQYQELGRQAGINVYLDSGTSPPTLAIWPAYGTRGGMTPLINAASGLVGYPRFQSNGMSFRCLFNPNLRLGGQIEMQSTVGGAPTQIQASQLGQSPASPFTSPAPTNQTGGPNGLWYIISPFSYDLSAQLPGGPWFCDVHCARTQILAPS